MGRIFTIQILFILGIPIWLVSRAVILFYRKKRNIEFNIKKEILTNLFFLYLIFLIGITIFPIYIPYGKHFLSNLSLYQRLNINLIPFRSYSISSTSFTALFRGLFGNFILLVPFISYLYIINPNLRTKRKSLFISFMISVSIEVIQLFLNLSLLVDGFRAVDIDDIILNTLGGVFAFYICSFIHNKLILNKLNNTF